MTTEMTLLIDAASSGLAIGDVAKLVAALVLGALLGWDIRVRNALPSARRRQFALAVVTFLSALGVMALVQGGAGWMSMSIPAASVIVPLSAVALLVLAGSAVTVLLRPEGAYVPPLRDTVFSMGFALALGLACGAGLPHVAIVIVPAALLFLNLMRWTPPAASVASQA